MLAVSGVALFVPRSLRTPGFSWLLIHEVFAGLYIAGVIVHIVASLTRGEPRTMWFESRDWADTKAILANFFGRRRDYPRFGKYDPLQKLYHAALALFSDGRVRLATPNTVNVRWLARDAAALAAYRSGNVAAPVTPAPEATPAAPKTIVPTPPAQIALANGAVASTARCQHCTASNIIGASECVACGESEWLFD